MRRARHVLVVSPHDIAVPTKDAYQWLVPEELTKRRRPH